MKIYNSTQKKKVEFIPIKDNYVKIYICGPTVYDDAHLGHARSSVVFDLLHRILKKLDYKVEFVKNYTDIDDKIINKMSNTGLSLEEITSKYTQQYQDDMNALNILPSTLNPKATDNIDAMEEFVSILLDKKIAYKLDDGIYFDTSKDSKYLSISGNIVEENSVQNRAGQNLQKRNFKDFALWKYSLIKPNYQVSFGDGRPGWHIECSAMINKHLAYKDEDYSIDIHGGGADLLFPHHENEATQSRCATGVELAKYWMHNGFVNIDGEKMSKSLGNSFFIKDALQVYSGEVLRFYLLSTYYRSNLNFNEDDLLSSKKRLDKIYRVKKRVYGVVKSLSNKEFEKKILEALSDDINISMALSFIDEFISNANDILDNEPKNKIIKQQIVGFLEFLDAILGIGGTDSFEYFQFGLNQNIINQVKDLINKRDSAKANKDYKNADILREELNSLGINIMDTAQGTVWEKI